MSNASLDKTGLALGRSWMLALLLAALHLGAFGIVYTLPLATSWRIALAVFVLANLGLTFSRHALRISKKSVTAFAMEDEGDGCRWCYRDASDWKAGRVVDRWISAPLTLLVVRTEGQQWPVRIVIASDAVAAEPFRRLRVRLTLRSAEE